MKQILSLLMDMTPNDNSLKNIMKLTASIINQPVALSYSSHEIICMFDNNLVIDEPTWNYTKKYGVIDKNLVDFYESSNIMKRLATEDNPILWTPEQENAHPILIQAIKDNDETLGYISFLILNEENLHQCFRIITQLSKSLVSFLSISNTEIKNLNSHRALFMSNLIDGFYHSMDELLATSNKIQFKRKKYYRLIIISYNETDSIYNREYYLNSIISECIIGTSYNGRIVLLVTYENSFERVMTKIKSALNNKHFSYLISHEFMNLLHTQNILNGMNDSYRKKNSLSYVENHLQILHSPKENLYNSTYEYLIAIPNGMELINTLATYIENNMNVTDCAKALFIHRNTTMYRLERIRIEGNIDLDNYLDLMNFYIYYCVKNDLL